MARSPSPLPSSEVTEGEDSPSTDALDRIPRLTVTSLGVSAALLCVASRSHPPLQVCSGLDGSDLPSDTAFTNPRLSERRREDEDLFLLEDASAHPDFEDDPLVSGAPGIRFCAAAPVETSGGACVATLYALSPRPRSFSEEEQRTLLDLSQLAGEVIGRKQTETALQKREKLHRTVLQNIRDAVFVAREDGTLTYVCSNVYHLLGCSRAEVEDMGTISAVLGGDPAADCDLDAGLPAHNVEHTVTDAQGAQRDVLVHIQRVSIQDGTVMYTCRDVTERKTVERDLRRNRNQLAKAQEIAHFGSWEFDAEDGALYWSDETRRIFGWSDDEVVSYEKFMAAVHPEDRPALRTQQAKLLDEGRPSDVTYRIRRPDGEIRHVRERGEAEFRPGGALRRVYGVVHDVTERREMEQLKSAFLANMSHEIRTPLTSILGFSEILEGHDLGDTPDRFVRMIRQSGERLLTTLNSVLHLSQLEAGSLSLSAEDTDAGALVRNVASTFEPEADEADVSLILDLPSGSTPAHLDPHALERILSSLLSNAVKFTAAASGPTEVTVDLTSSPSTLTVTVADTGIGMDPEFRPHMFEAFRQESTGDDRRFEGTGLGLTITKHLVDLMSGTIEVDSTPGAGTTITVELPRF